MCYADKSYARILWHASTTFSFCLCLVPLVRGCFCFQAHVLLCASRVSQNYPQAAHGPCEETSGKHQNLRQASLLDIYGRRLSQAPVFSCTRNAWNPKERNSTMAKIPSSKPTRLPHGKSDPIPPPTWQCKAGVAWDLVSKVWSLRFPVQAQLDNLHLEA